MWIPPRPARATKHPLAMAHHLCFKFITPTCPHVYSIFDKEENKMQESQFSLDKIKKIIEKLKSAPAFRQKVLDILNS